MATRGAVLVGAPDTAAGQFWAKREIARDDIEIVVAAENREDITGWRYARRLIPTPGGLKPRIRFKTWSFVEGGSKAKSVVGRLIDVNFEDTFVIRGGLLRSNIHKLPLSSFTVLRNKHWTPKKHSERPFNRCGQ